MSKDDLEKKPQDQEENIEDEAKKSTEFFLNFMKKSREDENKKKALKERNERNQRYAILNQNLRYPSLHSGCPCWWGRFLIS